MTTALFSYIYPLSDCRLQGRIIETFVIGVLIGLHSLLFVKAYFALQKPLWLLIMHIILELAFIGSVLMAAIGEAHIKVEVEKICLSILPERWLLMELVLDIVFNVFYSGIFLWVLKVQQSCAKSTHWKSLINDGLIYMFGITFSTTLLVTISIINGPAKTGVLLFAVAAVIGSCLMTSQLWKSTTRTSQANNTSMFSEELSKRSNQHGNSTRANDPMYRGLENGEHESHELKHVEVKTGHECECECFCQSQNTTRSRPESVLLKSTGLH
ncbi:hypothetical protein K493DRAFT_315717 [Basidiobolus meristosporus CBS 931.73]|uniref:Uncharacterized protein n=1 Tax=Basidiobolus meristosporus CBS 931.73 TaxID=1314790 RepID=A0A1Y1Y7M9_9FUNG|nr:hypothetical protein K493DRAFT_315717 [Basidiobolus meristosporus CBS 931.73]|eukprot:ORX94020.1 hypothetical protein K493DRAFT_315717 [Basidiobolus meristosporus CBS 931.73]